MNTNSTLRKILIAFLILILLTACSTDKQPSKHILFIGNSLTYYNGGVDKQLKGLASASKFQTIAEGGYFLRDHWNNSDTRDTISKGGWDYVVLQEQGIGPVIAYAEFSEYAHRFDAEIRKSGAKTILLMTWERPDGAQTGITTEALANATIAVGAQLGAKVAPVGRAFQRSFSERPNLVLQLQDGHPTMYGTYLAACVLYGTIYDVSPVGLPYADGSIDKETRDFFQRIAAETLGFQ
jgi:hypothetical protein